MSASPAVVAAVREARKAHTLKMARGDEWRCQCGAAGWRTFRRDTWFYHISEAFAAAAEAAALEAAVEAVDRIDGRRDDAAAKWLRERAETVREGQR